ncbi:MAG: hypothetical protein KBD01_08830 [Acidobacteria bacterium]|nr:hypothetical protein [Acidobacteriota bacterium]
MFEKALAAESRPDRRPRSLWPSLSSGAAHLLVLAAVAIVSLLTIPDVQAPLRADLEFLFLDPPPEPQPIEVPRPRAPRRAAPESPPEPKPAARPQPRVAQPTALQPYVDAPETPRVGSRRAQAPSPKPAPAVARFDSEGLTLDAQAPTLGASAPGKTTMAVGPDSGAGGAGEAIAYESAGASFLDDTIPAPGSGRKAGRGGGGRPGLIAGTGPSGTGSGVRYGGAPGGDDVGFGTGSGGRRGGRGSGGSGGSGGGAGSGIEGLRSELAGRYGLPLVSVEELGQRSTEAARWNMLLPRLAELLRTVLLHRPARMSAAGVSSIVADGRNIVIRYRDGVVHVLAPTSDGLAALFVARTAGARPVVSKVEEAESALDALGYVARGTSS